MTGKAGQAFPGKMTSGKRSIPGGGGIRGVRGAALEGPWASPHQLPRPKASQLGEARTVTSQPSVSCPAHKLFVCLLLQIHCSHHRQPPSNPLYSQQWSCGATGQG